MIGHYVDQLTDEQADAVLVTRLICGAKRGETPGAGDYWRRGAACIVGAATGRDEERTNRGRTEWRDTGVEERYDLLVRRFTARRIAAAIRNRILSNRLRRTLTADMTVTRHTLQNHPVQHAVSV